MLRRSTRWWLSTVLSLGLMSGVVWAAGFDEGLTAGQSAGSTATGRFGSRDTSNSNISVPSTDPSSNMRTVDGSTAFNGALTGPSSNKFLEIMIQPAATGDLSYMLISQDMNNDGQFDGSYVLPVPVSGICANGFIACVPGTWTDCQPYTWKANAQGYVMESAAQLTDLGGCYCINSSCGTNLAWQNSGVLLKDLAGGVVNSIRVNDPSLIITSVAQDITTITYYGQSSSKTTTAANKVSSITGSSTVQSQASYYTNWSSLTSDRDTQAIAQGTSPTSMYSLVSGVGNNSATRMGNCNITRVGKVNTTTESFSDVGSATFRADSQTAMKISEVAPGQTYEIFAGGNNKSGDGGGWGWTSLATISLPVTPTTQVTLSKALFNATYSDTMTYYQIDGTPATVDLCNTAAATLDGVLNGFDVVVRHPTNCPASSYQYPTADWSYYFEFAKDVYTEAIDDQCSTLASDSTCQVKDETVNGVVTKQNYNKTGLTALPTCLKFTGGGQQIEVCRDWWEVKRTYVCAAGKTYDFSDAQTRFGAVTSSVTKNGTGGATFGDTTKDSSGGWSTSTSSLALPVLPTSAECELACKTSKPKTDTQVTLTAPVSSGRTAGADSIDIFYKTCVNNVCPVDAGEQILKDCQCLSEFNEAAVAVQSLRLGGKDNVCSSGVRKPMKTR